MAAKRIKAFCPDCDNYILLASFNVRKNKKKSYFFILLFVSMHREPPVTHIAVKRLQIAFKRKLNSVED
jgi:hypothetical protein